MKSIINIGIIGFGTVGSGVYQIIAQNSDSIIKRTGIDIRIKTICDLNIDQVKSSTSNVVITDTWQDIVNDTEIDIVVELIGGIKPAKEIISQALKKGKSVVTANKKLLAEEGNEIFANSKSSLGKLGFEASVGGGIPCILSMKYGLVSNRYRAIMGILNGTTNYILTKMEEEGLSFPEALSQAQDKGFAEDDPTFDIEGYDAGHKISLLSMLAFGRKIDFSSILIEGITKISDLDIIYARDMGYVIKLLGIAKVVDDTLDIRVHPTMIPEKHLLASVRNEFNAIMYDCDMTDPVILYGKGAGSLPTASAIISDIIQIAEKEGIDEKSLISEEDARYILPENRVCRYYIRIHTEDKHGILTRISGVLAQHEISIASVIQKESAEKYVPLVIMTHEASEMGMIHALEEIGGFDFINGDITLIRVED